ncbi:hypothetical protein COCON_G00093040 [Conger conger]|uniref:protein-tyrosine-phosphatase n=1 Tax=Conger conger TaxID=82655 RepID=A0A9Q1DLR1_CONCO|nr:hypothetical protein COCON_G00093040 [Conger conger]
MKVKAGYRQKDCNIATQGPLAQTVEVFWKMEWEWRSRSAVMLTELQEREQPCGSARTADFVFGPPPGSEEQGQWDCGYAQQLQERLCITHDSRHAQVSSGMRQKMAYNVCCQGPDFAPGDRV